MICLIGYKPSARFAHAYEGHPIVDNDGRHENGGVRDCPFWQARCQMAISTPAALRQYSLPSGSIGRDVVRRLATEIKGVRNRDLNFERVIVFMVVILHKVDHVHSSSVIRRLVESRLQAWMDGKFDALVRNCSPLVHSSQRSPKSADSRAERFRKFDATLKSGRSGKAVEALVSGFD